MVIRKVASTICSRGTSNRQAKWMVLSSYRLPTICGISSSFLRASLVPMIKDGAVEFIRSPNGVAAIMVKPGFVNDMGFRRYLMS